MKRIRYADPPYPGQAFKHYAGDPSCAEVDHRQLISELESSGDAWALSTSSTALRSVLLVAPEDIRVAAWVKPFASFKPNVNPAYTWEPVLYRCENRSDRQLKTARDHLVTDAVASSITLKRGLSGAKPEAFCFWLFDLLGAAPDDELIDVFPGQSQNWNAFRGGNAMTLTVDQYVAQKQAHARATAQRVAAKAVILRQLRDEHRQLLHELARHPGRIIRDRVLVLDGNDRLIATFKHSGEAAAALGVAPTTIRQQIHRRGWLACGWRCCWADRIEPPVRKRCTRPIRRLRDGQIFGCMSQVLPEDMGWPELNREHMALRRAIEGGRPYRGEKYEFLDKPLRRRDIGEGRKGKQIVRVSERFISLQAVVEQRLGPQPDQRALNAQCMRLHRAILRKQEFHGERYCYA